uniref:Uncharacterized protein n=1 Tax=Helianthus annuus TaxID=4232 RepID=A0A251V470_HELAN
MSVPVDRRVETESPFMVQGSRRLEKKTRTDPRVLSYWSCKKTLFLMYYALNLVWD